MTTSTTTYRQQVLTELDTVPDEYLPFVLQMLRSFHDNVLLKPAEESFQQGWQEAQHGETYPVSTLWHDIDEAQSASIIYAK